MGRYSSDLAEGREDHVQQLWIMIYTKLKDVATTVSIGLLDL